MAINGKKYAWEDITINLPHGILIGVQDIEYGDKKEIEAVYGKGSNPVGYSEGNYSADGIKLTLLRDEYNKLNDYAKGQASAFYRLNPFPITVSYADEDEKTITDTLPSCKFTERKSSAKQGDKGLTVELSAICLDPIEYDGFAAND
ncbi:hypothetical protein M7775_02035 [Sporomusa sphaeroides DSM 2875]|uniref:hypothetical protein n=1 Tax=Sporomusa sphaeroides TaxID=47679 RepID=UPI00202F4CE4|nr:hypothetical protein [Sporomusa sphaeroides]MCM0757347.1 hypothetical protein [Sporomusa sphaeroides DSM 2875]